MKTIAVILERPEELRVRPLALTAAGDGDVVVDVAFSGISTGTERLLWTGRMPTFPGMGYPLVPGYESVGRVREPARGGALAEGDLVFVPGARCFGEVRGLFGGSASRLIVAESRILKIDESLARTGVLLALAATAYHALVTRGSGEAGLIVGHGVLGRLLARLSLAVGGAAPVVWERNPARAGGAEGYEVIDPAADGRTDYRTIYDVSGDAGMLDRLIGRLRPGGEIVLAGFYHEPISFAFPPAFMREARLRVAAQWQPDDLLAVRDLVETCQLSLDGLITHEAGAADAPDAYRTAFGDADCLKMILDWSTLQ